jgi:quinol---cytochrome c reductase cytochrome c subunit, bacillus type
VAEDPEEAYTRVLAEEQAKGSSPAVAEARAKAARMRARKGLPTDAAGAAAGAAAQAAAEAAKPAPAAAEPAAAEAEEGELVAVGAAAAAPASRGGGAAARAARAAAPQVAPDRIQRLLAVVRPEAIQRVERDPIDRVNVWPHLMAGEFLALLAITAVLLVYSVAVNAPLREFANINQTPNPSKAPWYFLGLQELLRYFHPQVGGATIPQWIVVALFAAPYIDRNPSTRPNDRKLAIVLFTIFVVSFAILTTIGSIFRGPGFNWVYPWDIPIGQIFDL